LPEVRAALVPVQRRVAARGPAVVAGRDIGTIIFPDAALKVFLTAGPAERARRRALDLAAHGATSELGAVLTDLERRDALDSGRAHAPLVAAPDAVQVDTEGRDADEVVVAILALWRARQEGQA
jgi:cytidylate kinase